MGPVKNAFVIAVTIVLAVLLAFGVPLGWIWIGSQVQGGSGSSSLDFSVAMLVFFGIVISYGVALYVAGWLMSKADPSVRSETQRATARSPWMRGMTDSRALTRQTPLAGGIERIFVITTLIASAGFWLWLLLLAGNPLPNP
jgi:cytochrome bd-type quinol oxidase subunit 2